VQQVTAVTVFDPVPAEDRAEAAHQHSDLVLGARRRRGAPQGVDEHVDRNGLAFGHGQQLQRQPRLPAAERLRLDPVHAEIAEYPDGQRPHA
jgi:hypothetical protein